MVLPKFNIKPLLDELMRTDIKSLLKNVRNESKILKEWNLLIEKLRLVSGKLARGEQVAEAELKVIKDCAVGLSHSATEFGSMVPGPIGIVCSVANAVVCFCEGNVIGGILELLGCIPGGKAATKGAAKFAPDMEKMIMRIVENSPELLKILKKSEKAVKELQTAPAGPKFDSDKFFAYGLKNDKQIKTQGLSVGQTMASGQKKMNKDIFFGTYGNPSNPFSNW